MPRSAAAYLADVLEACDAIVSVLEGVDDDAVYGVATEDLATLRRECASLLARAEPAA